MIMEIVCRHPYSITSVIYYRPGFVYGSLTCLKSVLNLQMTYIIIAHIYDQWDR